MKMRIAGTLLAVLLAASAFAADAAGAADVAGKWKASLPGPDGQSMELVFEVKVEGTKLTGTATSPMGEIPISNGSLDGDKVSFDVDAGGMVISHKGTVSGDTMKLKVSGGMMPETDMTATRVPAEKK